MQNMISEFGGQDRQSYSTLPSLLCCGVAFPVRSPTDTRLFLEIQHHLSVVR